MKTFVSEEDIAKHYAQDGARRYELYRQFQRMNGEATPKRLGISPFTLRRWRQGRKPKCVQGVDFLMERGLVPLHSDSSTLGIATYVAGLNWHSGMISAPNTAQPLPPRKRQPAYVPQFYFSEPLHLDEIEQVLDLKLKHVKKHKRYELSSKITLLLSRLGLPKNGRKATCDFAYPKFIDELLEQGDTARVALFLGTQALTLADDHGASYAIKNVGKESIAAALATGDAVYQLYRKVFPELYILTPAAYQNQRQGPYVTAMRLPHDEYQMLVEKTHAQIRKEIEEVRRSRELQVG